MKSNNTTISDYTLLYQSQKNSNNKTKVKKIFPDLLLTKTNFRIAKEKTKSPFNLNNKINNFHITKNRFRQINNSRSQKLMNKSNFLSEKIDKNAEKLLLRKIDEVNKSLEESENIFRYNQKILKKKLEEKNNEVISLKAEIEKEKQQKKNLYENIYDKNKIDFMNNIAQLQKQIEKLSNLNTELTEQNLKYEKKIQTLEKKDKENKLKLKNMNDKYNNLMQEKTNDLLENEIKQYINDLNIQIEQNQNELNSLQEEMSYINQENKKLKILTREIIEARNETEIYFLDSLNEVKKEIYKAKKERMQRDCFFPKLKKFYESGNENVKVDIRELTPEMREKILRNLFEKINRGYNERNFQELNYIMDADISDIKD